MKKVIKIHTDNFDQALASDGEINRLNRIAKILRAAIVIVEPKTGRMYSLNS